MCRYAPVDADVLAAVGRHKDKSQQHWGVGTPSPTRFAEAVALLGKVATATLPTAKLCLVEQSVDAVLRELSRLRSSSSSNNDRSDSSNSGGGKDSQSSSGGGGGEGRSSSSVGADDLMPTMCFVFCRATLPQPRSTVAFMQVRTYYYDDYNAGLALLPYTCWLRAGS